MDIEWDATEDYTFPDGDGSIVHGGLVGTVLDTAMGGACATVLEAGESFLTADLRVEFMRSAARASCAPKAESCAGRGESSSAPPSSTTPRAPHRERPLHPGRSGPSNSCYLD